MFRKRRRRFLGFRALSEFESPSIWKAVNRCQRRMLLIASLLSIPFTYVCTVNACSLEKNSACFAGVKALKV